LVANCSEVGVLGPVAGVIGTLQATETIKEILGIGDSLVGRLLIYDALASRFDTIEISWDEQNPLTGTNATLKDLSSHSAAASPACAAE
ncbi:ThiF family adenylyltransferase, partial [uncultured Phenylobacterium sp.]|uniref:HesA/MoeB/ThiF family protein n=1 Tax=uncultured Phenylobacterium sp. TaxID=349273 RepID=UPI00345CFA2E